MASKPQTKIRRHRGSVSERLEFYSMPEPNTGCLLWIGATYPDGYGRITGHGKTILTHRAAWENKNGPIPDGLNILHRCDTPACINPDHLFLGTQADNMADMNLKGRHDPRRGEANHLARLTDDIVRQIRASEEPQEAIARTFGIAQPDVSKIKSRKRWAHVE